MEPTTKSSRHEDPTQGECQSPPVTAPRLLTTSLLKALNAENTHYAFGRLEFLTKHFSTGERHERIALGLPLEADYIHHLSHQVGAFQSQLGEPTEAQQLAGKAALRQLSGTAHGQEEQVYQAQAPTSQVDECKEGQISTVNGDLDVTPALGRAQHVL